MEAPPEGGGGVGRTGAIGTGFLNRMLKKSASSVLDTREAYIVKRRLFPDSDVSRFTNDEGGLFEHPAKSFGRLGRGCQLKHGGGIAFGDLAAEFLAFEKDDAAIGASLVSEGYIGLETSPTTEFDGAAGNLSRRAVE